VPYADNAGVRIHYAVEGSGPELVLLHGFMGSIEDWISLGYVASLRSNYRLILIDSRGHGQSDKPHDEASYALDRRVTDITAVLDSLGIETAHFWGYSMGGYIGFGLAKHAPRRLRTFVAGGAHPYARDQSGHRQLLREGLVGGGDAFVTAFVKAMGPISDDFATSLRSADFRAWLAAAGDRVGVEDGLGNVRGRCCIYCGDLDPLFEQAKLAAGRIPKAEFVEFRGYSHLQAFTQSSDILSRVLPVLNASG
jgi:pimeloyl-ACP methyl ester carboxylesterase